MKTLEINPEINPEISWTDVRNDGFKKVAPTFNVQIILVLWCGKFTWILFFVWGDFLGKQVAVKISGYHSGLFSYVFITNLCFFPADHRGSERISSQCMVYQRLGFAKCELNFYFLSFLSRQNSPHLQIWDIIWLVLIVGRLVRTIVLSIGKTVCSFALLDPLLGPCSKENGHIKRFRKENAHFIGKIGLHLLHCLQNAPVFAVLDNGVYLYFSALTRQYLYLHHRALGRGVYQVPGHFGMGSQPRGKPVASSEFHR